MSSTASQIRVGRRRAVAGDDNSKTGIGFLSLFLGVSCFLLVVAYFMLNQDVSRSDPEFSSQPGLPLTRKLIWVDADAMRADFARDPKVMPTLTALASRGASGIAHTSEITLSLPAIKAWTTGRGFAAKDMIADFWSIDPSMDSIFRRAYLKRMSVAFSGPPEWVRSFKGFFTSSFTHNNRGPSTAVNDQDVQAQARRFLLENRYDIVVVHYSNADMTAHTYGAKDGRYAQALRQIDSYIRELVELAPADVTLLVIADHGTTDEGFHWEPAPEVVNAPFVLAGKGVEHVEGIELKAVDLAPTLAVLLGLDFSSQSEGNLALSVLQSPPERKAAWEIAYASARLHALQISGVQDPDASSQFSAAKAALANGDFAAAISLAQEGQRKCNSRIRALTSRRSQLLMVIGEVPGLLACLALFFILLRANGPGGTPVSIGEKDRNARLETLGGSLLCFSGLGIIWLAAIGLQDFGHNLILPFRYPVLISHWKPVAVALLGVSLPVALLTRKLLAPTRLPSWRVFIFGLMAVALCSLGQVHDLVYWSVILSIAVFGWRAILFDRRKLPEALLYSSLFVASLAARRINTLESWHGTQMGTWVSLVAFLFMISTFLTLVYWLDGTAGPSRKISELPFKLAAVSNPAWLLLGLGLLSQSARFFGWRAADVVLLIGIAAGLVWEMLSTRTAGSMQLSCCLAILATVPLLYPLHYFPVVALAMLAVPLTVKRLAGRRPSSETTMTLFALAVTLFLFFALSGNFDLRIIDIKRNQLLDPSFVFQYYSVARIALLLILQLLVPVLAVMVWVAYALRDRRGVWFRTNALIHFFFLVQMVTLVLYLQYRTRATNSLYNNLSQLVLVLVLYLAFHLSALLADRLVWGRRISVLVPIPQEQRREFSLQSYPAEGP